jgi:ferrous iron transport protein B
VLRDKKVVRCLCAFFVPLHQPPPAQHSQRITIGLWQRVVIFMKRVGGVIARPDGSAGFLASTGAPKVPAIEYSLAGQMGLPLAVVFEPIRVQLASASLVLDLAAR